MNVQVGYSFMPSNRRACASVTWMLAALSITSTLASSSLVDYSNSKIWGPGLSADSQLPTRYVYVQLYDLDGTR